MAAVVEEGGVSISGASSLVQRAQSGDIAAFEQLYRENVDRVFALCLRMSADARRAEELTQDVWVRVWEKLGTFRGDSAFTSWLHRLTVNVVLGVRRSEGRRAARVTTAPAIEELDAPAPQAEPGVQMDLEGAIRTLPDAARTVFVLYDVEGYAHAEIAEMTGRAEGTCKALLHRARKLLRERLQR